MKCKDIPDLPILTFLAELNGKWASQFDCAAERWIGNAMPAEAPPKLRLAKMGMLIRRKLVSGCICGCRGDFELTEKGKAFLETQLSPQS